MDINGVPSGDEETSAQETAYYYQVTANHIVTSPHSPLSQQSPVADRPCVRHDSLVNSPPVAYPPGNPGSNASHNPQPIQSLPFSSTPSQDLKRPRPAYRNETFSPNPLRHGSGSSKRNGTNILPAPGRYILLNEEPRQESRSRRHSRPNPVPPNTHKPRFAPRPLNPSSRIAHRRTSYQLPIPR